MTTCEVTSGDRAPSQSPVAFNILTWHEHSLDGPCPLAEEHVQESAGSMGASIEPLEEVCLNVLCEITLLEIECLVVLRFCDLRKPAKLSLSG